MTSPVQVCVYFALGCAALLGLGARVQAQYYAPFDVAAEVGDDIITQFDISSRLMLRSAIDGTNDTGPDARAAILEDLIDEMLFAQAARARDIYPNAERVEAAFASIAQNNGRSLPEFIDILTNSGVNVDSFRSNVAAQLVVNAMMASTYGQNLGISSAELAAERLRIEAGRGQYEWDLIEIGLATADVVTAELVATQLRQGASPEGMARRISTSPSAARSGRLGWVWADELDPAARDTLTKTPLGEVSAPVARGSGYILYVPLARRAVGTSGSESYIRLYRLFLSLENQGQSPNDSQKIILIDQVIRRVEGCEEFREAIATYGEGPSGDMGELAIASLPADIRVAVEILPEGDYSELVREPGGASIFMNCGNRESAIALSDDEIRASLTDERSRRLQEELRLELRRAAYIEYR